MSTSGSRARRARCAATKRRLYEIGSDTHRQCVDKVEAIDTVKLDMLIEHVHGLTTSVQCFLAIVSNVYCAPWENVSDASKFGGCHGIPAQTLHFQCQSARRIQRSFRKWRENRGKQATATATQVPEARLELSSIVLRDEQLSTQDYEDDEETIDSPWTLPLACPTSDWESLYLMFSSASKSCSKCLQDECECLDIYCARCEKIALFCQCPGPERHKIDAHGRLAPNYLQGLLFCGECGGIDQQDTMYACDAERCPGRDIQGGEISDIFHRRCMKLTVHPDYQDGAYLCYDCHARGAPPKAPRTDSDDESECEQVVATSRSLSDSVRSLSGSCHPWELVPEAERTLTAIIDDDDHVKIHSHVFRTCAAELQARGQEFASEVLARVSAKALHLVLHRVGGQKDNVGYQQLDETLKEVSRDVALQMYEYHLVNGGIL